MADKADIQIAEHQDLQDCGLPTNEITELNDQLELLCNQVEADQVKENMRQEKKEMHRKMDEKLAAIKAEKQQAKESQMLQSVQDLKDKYSGLLMSKRLLNSDDVDIYTSAREFIPIETLDQTITVNSSFLKAFFTIGVVVDLSGPIVSKSGKQFSILKLSDLVKYDLPLMKKQLQRQFKDNPEHVKMIEKCFNSNGYKTLKLMAFGDACSWVSKLNPGTVVGVMNPKAMKAQPDQGFTFCIELEQQVFKIGYSEELGYCKGLPKNFSSTGIPGMSTSQATACRNFLNKSFDTMCDIHKLMIQESQLTRIRSQRIGLHSDYIDLNKLRKQQQLQEQERMIGAFTNQKSSFKQSSNKGNRQQFSPKTQKRLQDIQKKEQEQLNNFLKERTTRAEKAQPKKFLAGIICQETEHLKKACMPGSGISTLVESRQVKPQQMKAEKSDDEFEIDMGQSQGLSLLNMIHKKQTYDERFPQQVHEDPDLKRKKMQ